MDGQKREHVTYVLEYKYNLWGLVVFCWGAVALVLLHHFFTKIASVVALIMLGIMFLYVMVVWPIMQILK